MATAMMAATAIVHLVAVGVFGRLPRHMAGEWGFQIADLAGRHWWNVLTTLFLSSSTASMLLGMAVLILVLGLAEFTVGTLRAAGLFLTTQFAAVVLYAGMVALGTLTGIDLPAGMAQATLLGPFAASAVSGCWCWPPRSCSACMWGMRSTISFSSRRWPDCCWAGHW